jgi:hypothetical protein
MKTPRRYQELRLGCGEGLVSRLIAASAPVRRVPATAVSRDRLKTLRGCR